MIGEYSKPIWEYGKQKHMNLTIVCLLRHVDTQKSYRLNLFHIFTLFIHSTFHSLPNIIYHATSFHATCSAKGTYAVSRQAFSSSTQSNSIETCSLGQAIWAFGFRQKTTVCNGLLSSCKITLTTGKTNVK